MQNDHLAIITVSQARRVIGVGAFGLLGVLTLYVATITNPTPLALIFLVVVSLGSLWFAWRMWRSTDTWLVLTEAGLFDAQGRELAAMDAIEQVERGVFAMKPSSGFALVLKTPAARAWAPGVWWRLGRRVAVGGVLSAHTAKPAADIITIKLAQNARG